jgi:hypothetical protein
VLYLMEAVLRERRPPVRSAARVQLPVGVRLYQVSMDRCWGVIRDADGVLSIVRYRLTSGRD